MVPYWDICAFGIHCRLGWLRQGRFKRSHGQSLLALDASMSKCFGMHLLCVIPPVLLGIPWHQLWEALSGTTSEEKKRPQPYWEGENSGNALEPSNALNYRAWGIPPVLSRGKTPETLWERFRGLSGIFPEFPPESPSRTGGVAYSCAFHRHFPNDDLGNPLSFFNSRDWAGAGFEGETVRDLQKGSAERVSPDLFWKQIGRNRSKSGHSRPWPSNPCFFRFPCFSRFPISLSFFVRFLWIFEVPRREKPCFFFWGGVFPCFFQKSKGWRDSRKQESEQIGRKRGNRNKSGWPPSADPKSGAPKQVGKGTKKVFFRVSRMSLGATWPQSAILSCFQGLDSRGWAISHTQWCARPWRFMDNMPWLLQAREALALPTVSHSIANSNRSQLTALGGGQNFGFFFIIFPSLWTKTVVKPLNFEEKSWRKNSEKVCKCVKCKPWTERVVEKGLPRGVSRAAWKRRINRELKAKSAHKPWIREGRLPWSANRELGTFSFENSSVSVHSLHFMVCAPLKTLKKCANVWKSAKKCGKMPRRFWFCPSVVAL